MTSPPVSSVDFLSILLDSCSASSEIREQFNKADITPGENNFWTRLAEALASQKHVAQAAVCLMISIQLLPEKHWKSLNTTFLRFLHLHDSTPSNTLKHQCFPAIQQLVQQYSSSTSNSSNNADIFQNALQITLGYYHQQVHRNSKESRAQLQPLLKSPHTATNLKIVASFLKARSYDMEKDSSTAMIEHDNLISTYPEFPFSYNNRAILISEDNRGGNGRKQVLQSTMLKAQEEALQELNKAIDILPTFHQALLNKANFLRKQNKLQEALVAYNRCLEILPNYFLALTGRCLLLVKLHKFIEALEDANKAIEFDPNNDWAYCCRGTVYSLGISGMSSFLTMVAQNPKNEHTFIYAEAKASRSIGLPTLFTKSHPLKKALKDFDRAISLNDKNADYYFKRASIHQQLRDFNSALQDYSKSLELHPGYAEVYFNKAIIEQKLGNYTDAEKDYTMAIKFNPRDHTFYMGRASLYKNHLGNEEMATRDFTVAKKLQAMSAASRNSSGDSSEK